MSWPHQPRWIWKHWSGDKIDKKWWTSFAGTSLFTQKDSFCTGVFRACDHWKRWMEVTGLTCVALSFCHDGFSSWLFHRKLFRLCFNAFRSQLPVIGGKAQTRFLGTPGLLGLLPCENLAIHIQAKISWLATRLFDAMWWHLALISHKAWEGMNSF